MTNGIACPHCLGPSKVRSSRAVTPTFRQSYHQCADVDCGFTFAVAVEVTHGISPSARPNPAVTLRMAPPRQRQGEPAPRLRPANDTVPKHLAGPEVPASPANDDAPDRLRNLA